MGHDERLEGLAGTALRVTRAVSSIAGPEAQDATQEAFARALANGVSVEAEPWLKTVAKRVAVDRHRRRREFASGAPVELEGFVREHDGDPAEALVRAERSQEVRRALAALPKRYRQALLTYAEEDSPAAVARRMGLSANAAWTLLSRARTRLRLQLQHLGYVPVAVLSRVRWRPLAIGGAAAGAVALASLGPAIVHQESRPAPPPRPIVQRTSPVRMPGPTKAAKGLVSNPRLSLPRLAAPVVKIPPLPSPPPAQTLIGVCLGTPKVPLAQVQVKITPPDERTLVGRLVRSLPDPLASIGQKSCPS